MTFLPDAAYRQLMSRLTDAAGHPIDPETALGVILADYLAPEAARDDIEAQDSLEAA